MTKIEWCDEVWNPVTGCSHSGSPGCDNCYAKRMATRLRGRYGYPQKKPFAITVHPNRFDVPRRWRMPRHVFVNSMGDLFHEDVPRDVIADIFRIMLSHPEHIFLILTKRPARMRDFVRDSIPKVKDAGVPRSKDLFINIWMGVTAENQEYADKRIPILLDTPAYVRFVSVEPMLGPVNLPQVHSLDWVICGAETGPRKRPMDIDWAVSLMHQCKTADVPFFFKKDSLGNQAGMPREFPVF